MTMPIGSGELGSLRSFFIDLSLDGATRVARRIVRHAMCQVGRQTQVVVKEALTIMVIGEPSAVCCGMTHALRTPVSQGHRGSQLAILRARKLLDVPESCSTEIDQPLYCRFNSATENPR